MGNAFCAKCGKPLEAGDAFCTACGMKAAPSTLEPQSTHIPDIPDITNIPSNIGAGMGGVQYKTIAGPVGLAVNSGEDYKTAVKKYAAIIDENAVGGWELMWIQQVPVTKSKVNIGSLLTVAAIGGAVGAILSLGSRNMGIGTGLFLGILVGGVLGAFVCHTDVVEFFNMLIFSKKD